MPGKLTQQVTGFTLALVGDLRDESDFIPHIKQSSKISPQLALSIYRNNTRGVRIHSLEVIYPACRNILGEDTFRSLAKACVDADRHGATDLNRYGGAFSPHLAACLDEDRLPLDYAYLPDLARLEYRVHAACYADPQPEFDFESFGHAFVNDAPISFKLNPSLGLLASDYPVDDIWRLNQPHSSEPQPGHPIQSITERRYLLVVRVGYLPLVTAVNPYEYELLDTFAKGITLQDAIESIHGDIDVVLPKLIANQWITAHFIGQYCDD